MNTKRVGFRPGQVLSSDMGAESAALESVSESEKCALGSVSRVAFGRRVDTGGLTGPCDGRKDHVTARLGSAACANDAMNPQSRETG
jgi:hypothetical protein